MLNYFKFRTNKYLVHIPLHGPLARFVKLLVAHAPGMPGTFSPPPRVSEPDMHHDPCVTNVPWCMPGSLTSGFSRSLWWRKTFPAFPVHVQPAILRIWWKAHVKLTLRWDSNISNQPDQTLNLMSGRTSYRKISWSLEVAKFGSTLYQSLWNLTGTSSTASLPRCLSNSRAMQSL